MRRDMVEMKAYILVKTTGYGTFVACVVASDPVEALRLIQKDMEHTKYREVGFDDVLHDAWIITPPESLTVNDLMEIPAEKVFGLAFPAIKH